MNILQKSLLVATGVVLGGVAVSSTFASFGRQNPEMNAAIEANDYSLLTAEMQEKISEERFDKMTAKHALHDAVKSAIEANATHSFLKKLKTD